MIGGPQPFIDNGFRMRHRRPKGGDALEANFRGFFRPARNCVGHENRRQPQGVAIVYGLIYADMGFNTHNHNR